jgi:ABC-type transporter Mla MlaB component
VKTASQERDGELCLQGSLEIYDIQALCQTLKQALAGPEQVTVNLGAVQGLDTAGVQALWSARQTAVETGKTLRFIAAPASVLDTWKQLGLPAAFFETSPS